jgi:hypothetical protein
MGSASVDTAPRIARVQSFVVVLANHLANSRERDADPYDAWYRSAMGHFKEVARRVCHQHQHHQCQSRPCTPHASPPPFPLSPVRRCAVPSGGQGSGRTPGRRVCAELRPAHHRRPHPPPPVLGPRRRALAGWLASPGSPQGPPPLCEPAKVGRRTALVFKQGRKQITKTKIYTIYFIFLAL